MGSQSNELSGPDLSRGVESSLLEADKPLLGHVGEQAVMLVRSGERVFATAASCTHYGGPLAEGLVVDGSVRCPWHHACFDLETGLAHGPALTPLECFDVIGERELLRVVKRARAQRAQAPSSSPSSVVIVGGGPAGAACAEALRRRGYEGPITLVAEELPGPVDRPNLSKDYLAGTAPEEWIPLRDAAFYAAQRITLALGQRATGIDLSSRQLTLASGERLDYGALVLATGAEARRLAVPGADAPHVHVLRTLADSRAIIGRAKPGARAVVIGGSFIGLEAAAALRARQVEVTLVAPDQVPLARVMGEKVGAFVRGLHERKGVSFHLGRKPIRITARAVELDDGSSLAADFVVTGVGVKPRTELAEAAGLQVEHGIVTDQQLRTSAPDVYAVGDVASYPDAWSGERLRIEHFAVAERQGQALAAMLLGAASSYRAVPFFWSTHYDTTLAYVGHASSWDRIIERGSLESGKYVAAFERQGKLLAALCLGEDTLGLQLEAAMEAGDATRLRALITIP
ncbi:MAG TPA: FAD-dependent oxidoreductase [Polyangiaceae bacterium]